MRSPTTVPSGPLTGTIVPNARIVVGHGQMHSDDLEEVMTRFVNGEADILLSFDGGEIASVHLSLSTSPALHEAILVGTKGVMRLTEYATGKPFGFGYHLDLNGKRIFSGDQEPSNYTLQLREFIHAVREGRPPIASGDEIARTTMPVLEAARRSDLAKRIVVIGA